jgi:hypothetical protein
MIIIEQHPRKGIRDDFGDKKSSENVVWIFEKGRPIPLRHIVSEDHLREIITAGMEFLSKKYGETFGGDETVNDDLVKQLESKDAVIEKLQMELEASEAEIKRIENDLKVLKEQKEIKSEPTRQTTKSGKGRGKR